MKKEQEAKALVQAQFVRTGVIDVTSAEYKLLLKKWNNLLKQNGKMTRTEINQLLVEAQTLRRAYNDGRVYASEGKMRQMLTRLDLVAAAADSKPLHYRVRAEIQNYADTLRPLEWNPNRTEGF